MKKALALILSIIMIISVIPLSVSAAPEYMSAYEFKATTNQTNNAFVGMKIKVGATLKVVKTGYSIKSAVYYNKTDSKELGTPSTTLPAYYEATVEKTEKVYCVKFVIHENATGSDYTLYGGTYKLTPIDKMEINPQSNDFEVGGIKWTKSTKTLRLQDLTINDTTSKSSPMFYFTTNKNEAFNVTVNALGSSTVIGARTDAIFKFDLANGVDNAVYFTGDGTFSVGNTVGNVVYFDASEFKNTNVFFNGSGSKMFMAKSQYGLYDNYGTNLNFNTNEYVSVMTVSGTKAMNKFNSIKFGASCNMGVYTPKGGYVYNGYVYDNEASSNQKIVTFKAIYPSPVINKLTEKSVYAPVNSAFILNCEATCPDGGAPKYWWEYNMDNSLESTRWSAMGTASYNGTYTLSPVSYPGMRVYRCHLGNTNAGESDYLTDTGIYSDKIAIHYVNNPFKDVAANQWYTSGVLYCSANKLMSGTASDKFEPNTMVSRAMLVMILANMSGVNLDTVKYKSTFTDVPNGEWYSKAVIWAADNGITSGTTPTTFEPNTLVTREQLATFFYSYAKKCGYELTATGNLSKFTDSSQISSWALTGMKWAVGKGLISGTGANTVSPKVVASRSQIALISKNFTETFVK